MRSFTSVRWFLLGLATEIFGFRDLRWDISKIYEMGPTTVTVAPYSIGFHKPAGYELSILFVDISGDGDPEFSVAFSDYWENGASITVDDLFKPRARRVYPRDHQRRRRHAYPQSFPRTKQRR